MINQFERSKPAVDSGGFLRQWIQDRLNRLARETSVSKAYRSISTATTALDSDHLLDCDGTFAVTLPPTSDRTGKELIVKNSGAGTITVDGDGAETIDGAASLSVTAGNSATLISDGNSNWVVV